MRLTSPAFGDGGAIPEKYGYTRENVNPPLEIEDVPPETETLVLIMDDPDAMEPAGKVWDHWVTWNIPPADSIGEGESPGIEGTTDYRERGYGGPNPPDGTHTYRFRVYALDTELELPGSATKEEVLEAVEGHVIEKAELEGTYSPV